MKRLIERVAIRNQFGDDALNIHCFPTDHVLVSIKNRLMLELAVNHKKREFAWHILNKYNQTLLADLINEYCYRCAFNTYTTFIRHQLSKTDAARIKDKAMLNNPQYRTLPPHPTDPHE